MTPALQLYYDHTKNAQPGDCFRACIAMLLDLPPADVPHFVEIAYNAIGIYEWDKMRAYEGDDVNCDNAARAWLQERGYDLIEWRPALTPTVEEPNKVTWFFANAPARYAIGSGTSPNGDWWHCVVLDIEKIRPDASLSDFIAADPNPSGKGIVSLSLVQFVVPMYTKEISDWCRDCILCHEVGWAHLRGHELNCQCETCVSAWHPKRPPDYGRQP